MHGVVGEDGKWKIGGEKEILEYILQRRGKKCYQEVMEGLKTEIRAVLLFYIPSKWRAKMDSLSYLVIVLLIRCETTANLHTRHVCENAQGFALCFRG